MGNFVGRDDWNVGTLRRNSPMTTKETISREEIFARKAWAQKIVNSRSALQHERDRATKDIALCDLAIKGLEARDLARKALEAFEPESDEGVLKQIADYPEPEGAAPEDRGETRTMLCSYCGHTVQTRGPGAIYCGPHHSSMGHNVYPAVQMTEQLRKPLPADEVDGHLLGPAEPYAEIARLKSDNEALREANEFLSKANAGLVDELASTANLARSLEQIAAHPFKFTVGRDDSYWSRTAMQLAETARAALSGNEK